MNEAGPLPTVVNGRSPSGRFTRGNRFARGNPLNRRAQALRAAYIRAVSVDDLTGIVHAIIDAAKAGDVQAAREVCDRVLGKAVPSDLLQRIEAIEQSLDADGRR